MKKLDPLYQLLLIYAGSIIGILALLYLLVMTFGCVTTQPVPDTRPTNNYHQLAKQAQQITNAKQ